MRMKSYYSNTVESAVELARRELGPEALLVNTRPAMPEARHLGEYEVVFAVDFPATTAAELPSDKRHEEFSKVAQEVTELRRQMERMAEALGRTSALAAANHANDPEQAECFASLVAAGMDALLAQDVLRQARQTRREGRSLSEALARELSTRLKVDACLGAAGGGRRIVALVGPPASGKTTTLVKLALRYGLMERRPTQILSADNYRVAAAEQLRSYAAILGAGFQLLETPLALDTALAEWRHKDTILIDTPGYGPAEWEDGRELAGALEKVQGVDVHLVLPATMKPADLRRIVERYEIFRPDKLVFTHLDETDSYGSIWNEALRTGKPVSFLCAGQAIPEDLAPANKQDLVAKLIRAQEDRTAAAA